MNRIWFDIGELILYILLFTMVLLGIYPYVLVFGIVVILVKLNLERTRSEKHFKDIEEKIKEMK